MNSDKLKQEKMKRYYNTSNYFDSRFQNFPNNKNRFKKNMVNNVFKVYKPQKNEKILDIGCGWGNISLELQKIGFDVIGIDYSQKSIEICKEFAKKLGLNPSKFLCQDATKTKFKEGYFDVIFASDLVEHLYPRVYEKVLKETYRILKENGKFIIYTPNPCHIFEILKRNNFILKKDVSHVDYKSMNYLKKTLKKHGFKVKKYFYLDSHVPIFNLIEKILKIPFPLFRRRNCVLAEKVVELKNNKKVLVFTSTFPRWKDDTIPPFVYELSKRLTNNFDIYVLAPNYPGAKKEEIMDNMKVRRFRYFFEKYETLAGKGGILPTLKENKWNYFKIPFFLLGEYFALRKMVKEIQPDVIHAHWIIPQGLIATLLKKMYGIEYVVTSHGGDIFGLRGKSAVALKKIALKNAKRITVVSNAIKREILEKIEPILDIEVISMGVDSKNFNPEKKDDLIKERFDIRGPFLLFVGRLVEKKGVKYLIDAMPDIVKKFSKTKLLIVGSGPLEDELKEQTKNLKLEKNIIFTGALANKELPKYYATADIFVGPSIQTIEGDTEGLGLTFVEAGISGIKVIGSNIGGISDVIKDKKTGLFIKQKNPKDISEKVIQVLSSKSLADKIVKNTREELIEKFDWNVVSKKYSEVLRK